MSEVAETPPNTNVDRLDGWKEIATYLGKSVRTVQRWEARLGLPIHRLKHGTGETIWATKGDIDDWRATRSNSDELQDVTSNQGRDVIARPRSSRLLPSAAILVAAAVIVSIFIARPGGARSPMASRLPARATVSDGALHVFDQTDRPLFSKSISFLRKNDFGGAKNGRQDWWIDFVDLDADGSMEVLFQAVSLAFHPDTSFIVLNSDGTERFRVRPNNAVVFGETTYAGPWRPHGAYLGQASDGHRSIFQVFIGPDAFPTLLLEIDLAGRVRSEYWSNGYIESVVERPWRDNRSTLFVGATNNETKGASLAVFLSGHPHGAAPAVASRYQCRTCAPSEPDAFLVFPRRGLATTLDRQATVQELRVDQDSSVHVNVGESARGNDGWFQYAAWYRFDRDLNLTSALLPDGFRAAYDAFVKQGILLRPFGPEVEQELFPVRRWKASGFEELPIAQVIR